MRENNNFVGRGGGEREDKRIQKLGTRKIRLTIFHSRLQKQRRIKTKNMFSAAETKWRLSAVFASEFCTIYSRPVTV